VGLVTGVVQHLAACDHPLATELTQLGEGGRRQGGNEDLGTGDIRGACRDRARQLGLIRH
jgi:hypothetical protein